MPVRIPDLASRYSMQMNTWKVKARASRTPIIAINDGAY
jgi:hypothetical protein